MDMIGRAKDRVLKALDDLAHTSMGDAEYAKCLEEIHEYIMESLDAALENVASKRQEVWEGT